MVKNVKVVFHTHAGTVPMVFIHTCSAIIDLPDGGYTGYTDFRVQMANTLFPQNHGGSHHFKELTLILL